MPREFSTSKAALQPPEEEGEMPVTVLVTGFGVGYFMLSFFNLDDGFCSR